MMLYVFINLNKYISINKVDNRAKLGYDKYKRHQCCFN